MIKEKIEIKNRLGIHARPAAMIAQEAGKYQSEIFISKDGMEVTAKIVTQEKRILYYLLEKIDLF